MAKLTVNEVNSGAVPVDADVKVNHVTDAKGRVIEFRDLDPLQESRIILAVGAQAAMNAVYVNVYAIPASRVSKIDGEEYSCPSNQAQIDGMITILGRAGMDALASHFFKNDTPPEKEGEKAATKN